MAYQIRYSDTSFTKKPIKKRSLLYKWITILAIIVASVYMLQWESVQNFLIPGDPDVTKSAFASFTKELKEGERFADAVAVFCREVIESDRVE